MEVSGTGHMAEKRVKEELNAMIALGTYEVPKEDEKLVGHYFFGYEDRYAQYRNTFARFWRDQTGKDVVKIEEAKNRPDLSKVLDKTNGYVVEIGPTKKEKKVTIESYHKQFFGEEAAFTRECFEQDLKHLIDTQRPTDIYTTNLFSTHWGHRYVSMFTRKIIKEVKMEHHDYSPILHETYIHTFDLDNYWPKRFNKEKLEPFSKIWSLPFWSNLEWGKREVVEYPEKDKLPPDTKKYKALEQYVSQVSTSKFFLYAFVKSDEFFFTYDYSNIALYAEVSDSTSAKKDQPNALCATNALTTGKWIDLGLGLRSNEWRSNSCFCVCGCRNPWITLSWDEEKSVNKIVLYDRPTIMTKVTGLKITFSDMSSKSMGSLKWRGRATSFEFEAKTTKWIKIEIAGAMSWFFFKPGLCEVSVFESKGQSAKTKEPVLSEDENFDVAQQSEQDSTAVEFFGD